MACVQSLLVDTSPRRTVWSRIYTVSTWILIAYFGLMAIIHVVLAMLFYLGVWDTGVGYFLDFEWPAWLIALLDGTAAYFLWSGYRKRSTNPLLGLVLTATASVIMIGRALWFVVIPMLVASNGGGVVSRRCPVTKQEEHHPRITAPRERPSRELGTPGPSQSRADAGAGRGPRSIRVGRCASSPPTKGGGARGPRGRFLN